MATLQDRPSAPWRIAGIVFVSQIVGQWLFEGWRSFAVWRTFAPHLFVYVFAGLMLFATLRLRDRLKRPPSDGPAT